MTQDEIISMMKEAGFYFGKDDEFMPEWERFAALVAAHERNKYLDHLAEAIDLSVKAEREACAQTVETESQDSTRYEFAAAIRARSEK